MVRIAVSLVIAAAGAALALVLPATLAVGFDEAEKRARAWKPEK